MHRGVHAEAVEAGLVGEKLDGDGFGVRGGEVALDLRGAGLQGGEHVLEGLGVRGGAVDGEDAGLAGAGELRAGGGRGGGEGWRRSASREKEEGEEIAEGFVVHRLGLV